MMYHQPVLLNECIEGLKIDPNGTYVDVTYGGGGHSKAILAQLKGGRLIAFDQDEAAEKNKADTSKLIFVRQNFKYLKNYLRLHNALPVNGILADLGVSSHQFDTAERGFSTRFEAELDMRMDTNSQKSAKMVLNEFSEEQLKEIFKVYGEIPNASKLAYRIVHERKLKPINKVSELKNIIAPLVTRGKENQYLAQVFQALRIEVNNEMQVLKELLVQSLEVLDKGGRLVVISYHSLEDRLVKHFMRKGKFEGEVEKDFFGNSLVPFELITKKPIIPGAAEMEQNTRSRSAKLRIAEKL
ncbi:MAG: 16S rRNA (cytosine(1402)-N(4))-methyltransferase RsmH [Bacteroidetes bacterium]|nr:16S rRNA (cytosine(1402)-N(4))-methyltransferase RsmH [Bacteroidota bacterium]MBK9799362.1 16S rRNA (cytosine(1402)-N(4))-methyltransferase RsmH [Bacteroidota bacterium]MBP6413373.1 16S rRNA (cytosine(1402)-N(4))-methyltransferase RsmH [Bacteroidia bacterium]